jgi:hypothetical protein
MSQVTVSPVVQALTVSVTTQSVSISASSPSGAASGDLAGSYPSPTVRAIRENPVQSGTPADGSLWFYVADDEQWNHVQLTDVLNFNNIAWDGTSLTVPRLTLQNSEYIKNDVDGRIDLMPAPHPSGDFGIYFDLKTSASYAIVGTIDSAGNLNTNAGFQFANTLAIQQSKALDLGNGGCYFSYFNTGVGNGVTHLAPYVGGGHSMAVCLVSQSGNGANNRKPTTAHTNPTLYVYAAGDANANHFVRLSHDGTAATMESGTGAMILTGASGVRINGSFGFGVTPSAVEAGWTTFTNLTTDRSCNANATTVDELADILGTLIEALKAKGVISA